MDIQQIDQNTYRMEDGFVRFFLLMGNEKAVMIDSGVNCPNAAEIGASLTKLPIILLNTHGDGDHTSGTAGFSEIYIHSDDYNGCNLIEKYPSTTLRPVEDGDEIDLGGRTLRLIHIPGHTAGSIAILDVEKRVLYAGDSVQMGHVYMFGGHRNPDDYAASLDKLIALQSEYDCIYASHGKYTLDGDYVARVKASWLQVRAGEVSYEMVDLFGTAVKSYTTEDCGFFLI